MEEKEIERIIREYIGIPHVLGVSKAAAEIAKLVEEDKWDAVKTLDAVWHGIEDEHLAQLAEMREALELLAMSVSVCPDCGLVMPDTAHLSGCIVDKALSAAPEVLYSHAGTLSHYQPGLTTIDLISERGGGCDLGGEIGKAGEQVKVIITRPSTQND